jgi:hypothetical protein
LKAKETQIVRVVLVKELGEGNHVAQAFRHFLVTQEQMPCVHEIVGPLAALMKALYDRGEIRRK